MPVRRNLNVIHVDVTNRDFMPEITNRSRPGVTEGGFEGKVRLIVVGVLTVAIGMLNRKD